MSKSNKAAANAPVSFSLTLFGTIDPTDVTHWDNGKRREDYLKVAIDKESASFTLDHGDGIELVGKEAMAMMTSRARYNPLAMTKDKWNELTTEALDPSKMTKAELLELIAKLK